MDIAFGYRVARDGRAVALDWEQPDGSEVTTFLPVEDLSALVALLLGAAAEAARRTPPASGRRPMLHHVMQPTDLQIIAPDDRSDWVLRVVFGGTNLDLEISRSQATALQAVLARSPQGAGVH